jgi:hypothetical protein
VSAEELDSRGAYHAEKVLDLVLDSSLPMMGSNQLDVIFLFEPLVEGPNVIVSIND